jgi:hypothetical protein
MSAETRNLRSLAAVAALAVALPALAQESEPPPPPPPPESLPWAAPPRPPPPPRARQEQPVYRPDYTYGPRRERPPEPAPYQEYPGSPRWARERPWYPHLEFSLRAGLASPGGMAADGLSMSDTVGEQATLGMELGLRATPQIYVGLLLEGGVGDPGRSSNGACLEGCGSSSTTGRLGLQLRYHLAPYAPIDPWFGVGMAVSAASVSGSSVAGDFHRTFTGFEFPKLSVGADLRLAGHASLGLYAEWTRGSFDQMEERQNGTVVGSGQLARSTDHSWFMVGPRLTF